MVQKWRQKCQNGRIFCNFALKKSSARIRTASGPSKSIDPKVQTALEASGDGFPHTKMAPRGSNGRTRVLPKCVVAQILILHDNLLAIFVLRQSCYPFLHVFLSKIPHFFSCFFCIVLEQDQKIETCIWTRILRYNLKVGKIKNALISMLKPVKKQRVATVLGNQFPGTLPTPRIDRKLTKSFEKNHTFAKMWRLSRGHFARIIEIVKKVVW